MTPSPPIPLNVFQDIIRGWEQDHPYNGAQVMHLAGLPDHQRLTKTWNDTLAHFRLGPAIVEGGGYGYRAPADPQPLLAPPAGLESFLSHQLNDAFSDDEVPFRPFVLRHDGASFYAGIVYRHWLADSVSIRHLMREWFRRTYAPDMEAGTLRHPRAGYWHHFGPDRGGWHLLDGLMALPRTFSRFRQVRKVRTRGSTDYQTDFAFHPAQLPVRPMLEYARRHRATVNDLFIAAAVSAAREALPYHDAPRRRNLAIASIVDLRPSCCDRLDDTFGLFLGFAPVFVNPVDLAHFPTLLRAVATQTRRQKERRTPAAGTLWMFASRAFARVFPGHSTYHFYRKHVPLAAGISNVNMARSWAAEQHPRPLLDYLRASPTGPMSPIVFTPTSLGDRLNLGLTYRTAVVSRDVAEKAAKLFLAKLLLLT